MTEGEGEKQRRYKGKREREEGEIKKQDTWTGRRALDSSF